jgi:cell division protein FtsI (penicillin-binding protein 3)
VKAILKSDGTPLWESSTALVRRVISKDTALKVTDILVHVVTAGTGQLAQTLFNPQQRVAGKTGTAQKIDPLTRRYHPTHTLISFCGFFPADQPRYTVFVMLDEPEGRRWGGTDAAPVFRRIAEEIAPIPDLVVKHAA